MPYSDQWQFLNSVQKVDEKIVKKILSELESQVANFVEKDESETVKKSMSIPTSDEKEKLSKDDFPQKVHITLSNFVEIEKTGIALGVLRRTAVFMNPGYFKNLKMHLPLYNIPRFIDCSKEDEKCLLLPRGNLNQICNATVIRKSSFISAGRFCIRLLQSR